MRLRGTSLFVASTAFIVFACRSSELGSPRSIPLGMNRRTDGDASGSPGSLVACSKRASLTDSAEFGPSGGVLVVGQNRLTIPPGALTRRVMISGTIVGDTVAFVQFQPEGLRFRKPAGLALDATGCDISDERAPDIVYLNDRGEIIQRIEATYSNAWHTIAAPIEHFSGYAIAF